MTPDPEDQIITGPTDPASDAAMGEYMVMHPEDRERLWKLLEPLLKEAQAVERKIPTALSIGAVSGLIAPAGAYDARLDEVRSALALLSDIHGRAQDARKAFVPLFPETHINDVIAYERTTP